jgi:hypothetical protein
MTIAIHLRIARWRNATLHTSPAIIAFAITAIRLVQISGVAMASTVVFSNTRWRHSTIVSSEVIGAIALATVSGIKVLGAAMTVAQLLDFD